MVFAVLFSMIPRSCLWVPERMRYSSDFDCERMVLIFSWRAFARVVSLLHHLLRNQAKGPW